MQVLYVEDNAVNAILVERIFARIPSARLSVSPTGRAGITSAQRNCPDLIFLDLHLPDMTGEDVLCELRADPTLRAVPVVVLTADAATATRSRALALGATAVLTKPVQVSDIIETVTRAARTSEVA